MIEVIEAIWPGLFLLAVMIPAVKILNRKPKKVLYVDTETGKTDWSTYSFLEEE